ncbi:hypothetical protein PR048_011035 [Dryococelus australis]|uniref:Uncharacterized protein n=1 Tax=Dryococelus australis TaxID=614101 RepID=A0ABQ9HKG0_9NEOP|nr:hypothetical protein PR048_011035 [Dryococelus australis]
METLNIPMTGHSLFGRLEEKKQFIVKKMISLDYLQANFNHVKWIHMVMLSTGDMSNGCILIKKKKEPGILYYKTELDESDLKTVSFRRRGRSDTMLHPQLKYRGPNAIRFVSPVFHQFYKELETSKSARNVHPDTIAGLDNNE